MKRKSEIMKQMGLLLLLCLVCYPAWAQLSVGSRVSVNSTGQNLNVRVTPAGNLAHAPGQGQPHGTLGTIVGGPQTASLSGTSYTWWNVNFDSGPDGWVASIGLTLVTVQPTPSISSVSPSSMPASNSRQTLTINGSNFQNGATLTFDPPNGGNIDSSSSYLTFVSNSRIRYEINNASDVGTWRVRVNNPGGQSSNWESFTVSAPQVTPSISSVSPSSMPASNSRQTLTINGSNFRDGATLTFDPPNGGNIDSSSSHLTFVSSSRIRYEINNDNDVGTWRVRVNNPDGQFSDWESFTVESPTLPSPEINSVNNGNPVPPSSSNQSLVIDGVNFQNGCTLTFRDTDGDNYSSQESRLVFNSSSRLTYQFNNANDSGIWQVRVNNPDGKSSSYFDFTVSPVVTPALSVTPTSPPSQPATAGTINLNVSNTGGGTMSYSASVTPASSWLRINSGTSGGNSGTIVVGYDTNNTGASRSATIQVTATGASGSPTTVTIAQQAGAGGNKPLFQLPFACGETWYAYTHDGESHTGRNTYALDMNKLAPGGSGSLGLSEPVLASASGQVTRINKTEPTIPNGIFLEIDHGGGWRTVYLHLQEGSIPDGITGIGSTILAGQAIGRLGSTGNSTGPHLHYDQRLVDGSGYQTQPVEFNGQPVQYVMLPNKVAIVSANCGSTLNYTISLSASPSAGGTVSDGGTYPAGSSRTVTATANNGYTFENWTEGGSVVSSSANYSFILNGNRTLVANFAANPPQYADLVPQNLSASPSSGQAGSSVQVSFNVRNNGPGDSLATTANIRLSTSSSAPSLGDPLLGTVNIGVLSSGGQHSFSPSYTIPVGTTAGQRHVWVIVEPTGAPNANQGPNINNDRVSAAFTVTSAQPATYSIAPNPAAVGEGAGTLVFTITRLGSSLPAETLYASTVNGAANGYAVNSGDYATDVNNLPVNFTLGATTRTVTVTILNDTTVEPDETFGFIVQRSASDPVSTYLDKATFTITDDDSQGGDMDYPGALWIAAGAGHFTAASRTSADITAIVIHTTEDASYGAAIAWFQDPGGDTSAHYIVRRDGSVVQMVREKDIAHHAGSFLWNQHSIGIEVERLANATEIITTAQYETVKNLVNSIRTRCNVPLIFPATTPVSSPTTLVAGIVGHGKTVDNGVDPVKWDWAYLQSLFGPGSPLPTSRPRLTGNTFGVSVPSQVGVSYVLEFKTSLEDPNWTLLQRSSGAGGPVTLNDPTATEARRFYRVREE